MGPGPDKYGPPFFDDRPTGQRDDDDQLNWGPPPVIVQGGALPAPPSTDPEDNPSDLRGQAAGRVLTQYRNSTKLLAFIDAIVSPIQEIENVLTQIPVLDDVDVAGGVNLDVTGDLVGQSRALINGHSANDPQYRLMIKARIVRNSATVVVEDVNTGLSTLFPGAPIVVMEHGDMAMGYAIGKLLSDDEVAVMQGPDIVARPMGVLVNPKEYFNPTAYFGFAEDPKALGMADDSVYPPLGGGHLATEF